MNGNQFDLFEVFEKIDETGLGVPDTDKNEVFFPVTSKALICVICSASFEASPRSSANVCSAACRRERQLRYGAVYRQEMREKRARLLNLFGGRQPTEEDFLKLIQQRKGKS